MIPAFIAGLCVAGFGALLSLIVNNWFVAMVFSGTVGVISIVGTSILRNAVLVMGRSPKARELDKKSIQEADKIAKMVGIFGFPNIALAVIAYLRMYGVQYIVEFFK